MNEWLNQLSILLLALIFGSMAVAGIICGVPKL